MKTAALHNPLRKGADIRHLQSLLHKRGFLPANAVDGVFGPQSAEASLAAHKAYGLKPYKPVAGDYLVKVLERGKPVKVTHKVVHVVTKKKVESKKHKQAQQRAKVVDYCEWGIAHEPDVHYSQVRPMDYLAIPEKLPIYDDCSEFGTKAHKYAGLPDPNGRNYNGLGYTGDMLNHMHHITISQVLPGDFGVYGAFPGHHMVIVMSRISSSDFWLCSHGQERGPIKIKHSVEKQYQPHYVTWLRNPALSA